MADSVANNIAAQSQAVYLKPAEAKQQQQPQAPTHQQSSHQAPGQIGANSGVAVVSALKAANDSFARIVMTGLISNPSGAVSEVDLSSFSNDPNINVDKETTEAQLANSLDRAKEYEQRSEFADKSKHLYDKQSEDRNVVERSANSEKLQSAAQEISEDQKNIFLRVSEGADKGKGFSDKEARFFSDSVSENGVRGSTFDQSSSSKLSSSIASSTTTQLSVSVSEKNGQERLSGTLIDSKQAGKGQTEPTEKERILTKIQAERFEHRQDSDEAVSSSSKEKMQVESTSRIDVPAVFSVNHEKQHRLESEKEIRKIKPLEKLSPLEKLRRRIFLRREIGSEFSVKN